MKYDFVRHLCVLSKKLLEVNRSITSSMKFRAPKSQINSLVNQQFALQILIKETWRQITIQPNNDLSKCLSEIIKTIPIKQRLQALRDLKQTDKSLEDLYSYSLNKEDYDTCALTMTLLLERDCPVPVI